MKVGQLQHILSQIPPNYEVSIYFDSGIASEDIDAIGLVHATQEVHLNLHQDTKYDAEFEVSE